MCSWPSSAVNPCLITARLSVWSGFVSEAWCHQELRAIRDYCGGSRLTKCIGNYSGLFIPFLQSFSFNAKYGIKRKSFTNNKGEIAFLASRCEPCCVQTKLFKSSSPCIKENPAPILFHILWRWCLISISPNPFRKLVKTVKRLWKWEDNIRLDLVSGDKIAASLVLWDLRRSLG